MDILVEKFLPQMPVSLLFFGFDKDFVYLYNWTDFMGFRSSAG